MAEFRRWAMACLLAGACSIGAAAAPDASPLSSEGEAIAVKVRALIDPLSASKRIPGAVAAVVDRNGTWLGAWGEADIERKVPMDARRTHVRVASITKSFTALMALQLVEEGRIRLDESTDNAMITERIQHGGHRSPNVENLFTHRAALDADLSVVGMTKDRGFTTPQGWLSRQLIAIGQPGEIFGYDNAAYAVLGQIIADADKTPLQQSFKRRLLEQLGMHDSMLGIEPGAEATVARCYQLASGTPRLCEPEHVREHYQADGDLTTTARDMAAFLHALIDVDALDGILSPTSVALMSTTRNRIHRLGAGVGLGAYGMTDARGDVYGHSGGIRGATSLYLVSPSRRIGVFIHINASSSDTPRLFPTGLIDYLNRELDAANAFDPDAATAYEWPYQLATLLEGSQTTLTKSPTDSTCDRSAINGTYQYVRIQSLAAFGERFLARGLLPPVVVQTGSDGSLAVDGQLYRPVTPCYYLPAVPSGLSAIDASMAFRQLQDGRQMAGPHPLVAILQMRWYETAAMTVLLPLFSMALIAAAGAFLAFRERRTATGRAALHATLGLLIFLAAVLCEMEWAIEIVRSSSVPWLVLLWRTVGTLALAGMMFGTARLVHRLPTSRVSSAGAIVMAVGCCGLLLPASYWLLSSPI